MKNYTALIKVTRLHEIGFESSNSKQALEDAKAIIADESFNDNSHIHQQLDVKKVVEDKSDNEVVLKFRQRWEKVHRF